MYQRRQCDMMTAQNMANGHELRVRIDYYILSPDEFTITVFRRMNSVVDERVVWITLPLHCS